MEERNQVVAAEKAKAYFIKQKHDDANYMTTAEREKADRMKLYAILKAHGSLGTYYSLYPDERPKEWLEQERLRNGGEQER